MMISIHIDTAELHRAAKFLSQFPGALEKANKRASNRALEVMRTTAARIIPQEYEIKPRDVREAIRIVKAQTSGVMHVRGKRRPLNFFRISPKRPPVKKGFMASVRKSTGMKFIPKGFYLRFASGYYPFIRTGRSRGDIKMLVSMAIPQMLEKNEALQNDLIEKGQEAFTKNFSYWVSQFSRQAK